jgi:hypothetical protein
MSPLTEARRTTAMLAGDLRKLEAKRQRDLAQWTRDKLRWQEEKRALRKRERQLLQLLASYLAGDITEADAEQRLEQVRAA